MEFFLLSCTFFYRYNFEYLVNLFYMIPHYLLQSTCFELLQLQHGVTQAAVARTLHLSSVNEESSRFIQLF